MHVVMQLHFPRNALCILCIKAFQCMNTGARIVTSVVFFLCVIRNLPPQPFAMSRYHIPPPSEMDSSDTESESDDQPRINAVLSETASKRILLRSDVEYTLTRSPCHRVTLRRRTRLANGPSERGAHASAPARGHASASSERGAQARCLRFRRARNVRRRLASPVVALAASRLLPSRCRGRRQS